MSTQDYLRKLGAFRKELNNLERDKTRNFYSSKSLLREELSSLEEEENNLTQARTEESRLLVSSISKIKQRVCQVSSKVTGFLERTQQEGAYIDYDSFVVSLQKAVDSVDSELKDFKSASKENYEKLQHEEDLLSEEVNQLAERFANWEKETTQPKTKPVKEIIKPDEKDPLKKEVQRITREIEDLGGAYLGLDETDFQEFMKVKTQHKNKLTPAFLAAARNVLPMLDQDSIKLVFQKHETFLQLNQKKKEVVAKWKQSKQTQPVKEVEVEEPKKPLKRPQSALATKKKIQEWKQQKAQEELLKQQEKQELLKKQKQELLRKQQETQRKKQVVSQYKEQKEIEKVQQEYIQKYVERRKTELSLEDKERLKQREDKIVQQRLQRLQQKQQENQEQLQKATLRKMKTQAQWSHLDSRLTKETAAAKHRSETKQRENTANTFGGDLLRNTGRAMPAWRAQLR